MSSPDRVRVALIGAGRMGSVHLRALRSSSSVEVAAVVEPMPAARQAVAASGLDVYTGPGEFLEGGEADGVLIAAPSDQHPALVSMFAESGLPVLCEKPVGIRTSDASLATEAADRAGIPLQVGYWRRFVPELRVLRERIGAGELGEIIQLSCMQWDAVPPDPQFRAHSGGIAVDMGVHEFDQTRWLLGQEFTWVAALPAGSSSAPAAPSDPDNAVILARLSGGSAATVSLGRHFPHADSCWVEVWGTRGYARLPFLWDADVWGPGSDQVFLAAMVAQVEAFAETIRGGRREGADGEDAVAALSVAAVVADSLDKTPADTKGRLAAAP